MNSKAALPSSMGSHPPATTGWSWDCWPKLREGRAPQLSLSQSTALIKSSTQMESKIDLQIKFAVSIEDTLDAGQFHPFHDLGFRWSSGFVHILGLCVL